MGGDDGGSGRSGTAEAEVVGDVGSAGLRDTSLFGSTVIPTSTSAPAPAMNFTPTTFSTHPNPSPNPNPNPSSTPLNHTQNAFLLNLLQSPPASMIRPTTRYINQGRSWFPRSSNSGGGALGQEEGGWMRTSGLRSEPQGLETTAVAAVYATEDGLRWRLGSGLSCVSLSTGMDLCGWTLDGVWLTGSILN